VPLLVHHPKAPHTWHVHTKSLVEHVDLYPTTAELAGVPVTAAANESIEGASYAALFAPGSDPHAEVWTNEHNASFTQYPRCGETTSRGTPDFSAATRCAHVPKSKFAYMGYSMRTTRWRYTEWAEWDGGTLQPEWAADVTAKGALVELYDHQGDSLAAGAVGQKTWDDFENENVASENPSVVRQLSAQLRGFYSRVRRARGTAYGES
jgi:iduronate 2-sulfatase